MSELIKSSTLICLGVAIALIVLSIGIGSALDVLAKMWRDGRGRVCPRCNGARVVCWDNISGKPKLMDQDVPCPKCNGVGRVY